MNDTHRQGGTRASVNTVSRRQVLRTIMGAAGIGLVATVARQEGVVAARSSFAGATRKNSELRSASTGNRTVSSSERGMMFGTADGSRWNELGLVVDRPYKDIFGKMAPDAIKVPFGRIQHFRPKDNATYAYFPYDELKAYEAQEVAAGRPPIFVTATHNGAERPVYFSWHLGLDGANRATAAREEWSQAVNVRDDRFIRFWIDRYVRQGIHKAGLPNMWVGVDNASFMYSLYGVVNDGGTFVPGVTWNSSFPQSDNEWVEAIKYFFRRVKELAPDIRIICNEGSLSDPNRVSEVFADVDGLMNEDILVYTSASYESIKLQRRLSTFSWLGNSGKVGLVRVRLPNQSSPDFAAKLRDGYIAYLLVRGDNFFFNPKYLATNNEVSPRHYQEMHNQLGRPIGLLTSEKRGATDSSRLYQRETESGIVFLNWTGQTQTVTLPSNKRYLDRNGKLVKQIKIANQSGDYVQRYSRWI